MQTLDIAGTDGELLTAYRRAQDCFDAVLSAVPAERWDSRSACPAWTARDIAGHVVWGQELVRHLATGRPYTSRAGAPGAENPGSLVPSDPLTAWRAARAAAGAALTAEALLRPGPPRTGGTLLDFVNVLIVDTLAHSWDIALPLGIDANLPADLIARTLPFAKSVTRAPGMFGADLGATADADTQARWLSALGRAS